MHTRVLSAADDPDGSVAKAAALLRAGGLVAFPTETVYGLGARGLDADCVERIFAAKGRPHSDPVILHIATRDWLERLAEQVPPAARDLAQAFWPGPLTLVLRKSDLVPLVVTAGGGTVAVRMPAHPIAARLIAQVGEPLAAPSANLFSRPSPTTAAHVLEDLSGRIDAVLDGGPTPVGVESTVVDVSGPTPTLLRPGGVTREALEAVLGRPTAALSGVKHDEPLPSPGLLTRHYSPRAEVHLLQGEDEPVYAAIRELCSQPGLTAVLAFSEDLPALEDVPGVRTLGSRADLESVARGLYSAFRAADEGEAARIVVRMAPERGLGAAINDRLRRAAAGRVRKL